MLNLRLTAVSFTISEDSSTGGIQGAGQPIVAKPKVVNEETPFEQAAAMRTT